MVAEIAGEHESEWAAMGRVAELLGVSTAETVRKWVRQAEVDAGARVGTSSEESSARTWEMGERHGVSFKASRVEPWTAGRSSGEGKAA